MWDGVREVCNKAEWDFYVDHDKDLHAFPIGSIETPETFENRILGVKWVESGDKIINAQRVIGRAGKTIGSDATYTESITNWGTNAEGLSGTMWVRGDGAVIDPDPDHGAGSIVIRAVMADASGGMYLQRTFPTALDLSMHGVLNFTMKYSFDSLAVTHGLNTACQIQVDFKTDDSNYFTNIIEVPGKMVDDWGMEMSATQLRHSWPYYRWTWGWDVIQIPFNIMSSRYPFAITGNPRWDSISKIRISPINPLALSGIRSKGYFKIDNMYFDRGYYYSFRTDSSSIGKYGERRGKLLYVPEYGSDSECEGLADQIVATYKDPVPQFKNLRLNDWSTVNPGDQATITVKEISNTSIIRLIEHDLNGYNYSCNIDLASRYIPEYEKILADMKKDVDSLLQNELPADINPSALFKFLTGPLGPKDVDMAHSQHELIWNAQFELDSDMDGIPDKWYPSSDTIPFRTEDDSHEGQYAAILIGGETLESEYFPINRDASYRYGVWAKTSSSTLSASIVYYGTQPTLTPTGTLTLAESVSPSSWTQYTAIDGTVPANSYWGLMRLVGESGTISYIDDVFATRLRGVAAGTHIDRRDLQYTTANESLFTVCSRTFNPGSMMYKYAVMEGSMELKLEEGLGGAYIGQIVIKYNDVPRETLNTDGWSGTQTTYTYYSASGSIDYSGYGETLTVDYKINSSDGDTTYMRYPQIKILTVALAGVVLTPYGVSEE